MTDTETNLTRWTKLIVRAGSETPYPLAHNSLEQRRRRLRLLYAHLTPPLQA